jgi:hypothetical protein
MRDLNKKKERFYLMENWICPEEHYARSPGMRRARVGNERRKKIKKVQIPFASGLRDNSLWAPVREPQAH